MDNLIKYPDWKYYRFSCDCMCPDCCMHLEIETDKDKDCPPVYIISVNVTGSNSWWIRLKRALRYLSGKDQQICVAEMVLRQKDREELIKVLSEKCTS